MGFPSNGESSLTWWREYQFLPWCVLIVLEGASGTTLPNFEELLVTNVKEQRK